VESLPWVFTSGWASGINSYLVVVLLGAFDRLLGVEAIPDALQRTDVLAVAGVLFVVDTVADKIPYVDSTWDAVHTVIRPAMGAAVAALIAGDASSLDQALLVATGGLTALSSHLVKAGLRAAVNTSPEPASNIAVSVTEDVAVAGLVSLAVVEPVIAAVVAGVLLTIGVILVALLWRRVRAWRRARRRRAQDRDTARS
jgi:hypothetical protein